MQTLRSAVMLAFKSPEPFTRAIDAVTGKPIPLAGDRIRLTIPAGLFRSVSLTR